MDALFGVPAKKKYTEIEQEQIIRGINGTMLLEDMGLTDEDKDMLRDILSGRKTQEECIKDLEKKWSKRSRK